MELIHPDGHYQNVHSLERLVSIVGGLTLAATGFRKSPTECAVRMIAGAALVKRGLSGQCDMYRMLGVRTTQSEAPLPYELGIKARASVTVSQPRDLVFKFWRQFENLPRFMRHLKSVESREGNLSHWVAQGPLNRKIEWDAEIINEVENELLAWKSLPGADVDSAGSVRFKDAPGGRGTEIRVKLQYNPPAGAVGAYIARLFGREPEQEIVADLQRLRQYLESGEVSNTEGQSRGGTELQREISRVQEEVIA